MPGTVMEKIDGSASMAYTLDDVRAAMTYAKQGNNTAFAQMIYNGKIRPLPNGTRVEVVNLLDEILEVSVKSGQYAGEHGYMNILMVDIDGVPFGPVETPRRR